jgi:hypothetical protein
MVQEVECECCLKIGFLNNVEVYDINAFREVYDLLIIHDGDFTVINSILNLVCKVEGVEISEELRETFNRISCLS